MSAFPLADAVRVYIAFAIPGIFAAPLLRRAFPNLPDGGAAVARPMGWALIAWVAWILPSIGIVPYGTPLVLVALAALAALGAWIGWTDRARWRERFADRKITMVTGEAFCLAVFALCCWQVQYNGDVHPLAERFMDYAILQRLEFTKAFPPEDSWMAGLTLQYYYYGYVLMDCLRRIGGLELRAFFNLALAGIYASFALALWGCGLALTGKRIGAFAALVGGAFVGNYEFVRQIVAIHGRAGVWRFDGLDWFRASRVIPGTINEVPAFSLFWGDVHPYLIAFPVVGLCLCLAIAMARGETPPFDPKRSRFDVLLTLGLLAVPIGALYPTNSWDFPTFLGLALLALALPLLPAMKRYLSKTTWTADPAATAKAMTREPFFWVCAMVVVFSIVAYLPFHIGFGKQVGRGVRLAQRRSDVLPMMLHFGPWIAAVVFWAAATAKDRRALFVRVLPLPAAALALGLYETKLRDWVAGAVKALAENTGILHSVAEALDAVLLRGLAFVFLVALLWVLAADLEWDDLSTPEGIARTVVGAALGVVLVCEFAYVDDFYGGENERMNTIFKAYIQAWILLAVGTAGLLTSSIAALAKRPRSWKAGFAAAWLLALVPGLAFAALADYSRSDEFTKTRSGNPPTWDPLDLFKKSYPADYRAVEWIAKNLPPDSRILEGTEHAYQWESRIATFTGRLGLIGWKNHESGWRNTWTEALARGEVVDKVYGAETLEETLPLLRTYGVEYVYVGELERNRAKYPKYRLGKFDGWERVFADGPAALYRVPPSND